MVEMGRREEEREERSNDSISFSSDHQRVRGENC